MDEPRPSKLINNYHQSLRSELQEANKLEFRAGLEILINSCCMENGSNTPDYVLAVYLQNCLCAFDEAIKVRDKYYGITTTGTGAITKHE